MKAALEKRDQRQLCARNSSTFLFFFGLPNSEMKTTTITLWLRVENNSKFVRGKKRACENIERFHLQRYGMKKLKDWEYELTFAYENDAGLDKQVSDLLQEIEQEADMRDCFIEADLRENGTDRSW